MKKALLLFIAVLSSLCTLHGQPEQHAYVTGSIVDDVDGYSLSGIEVAIPYLKVSVSTDTSGVFILPVIKHGRYTVMIRKGSWQDSLKILADTAFVDLGTIAFHCGDTVSMAGHAFPDVAVNAADGDDNAEQDLQGLLYASRDVYTSMSALQWSAFHFRPRGYKRDQTEVYLNGICMNDAAYGAMDALQGGGLNGSFAKETSYGMEAGKAGFGGLSGTVLIRAVASILPKQTSASYLFTNSIFSHSIAVSHSSGLQANGWAYAVSLSKRWSQEGYVPGSFYDGYSFYAAASKRLHASSLHLTVMGARVKSGRAAAATAEAIELSGSSFYNPAWGYQQGEKRNASVNRSFRPVAILNYDYTPDDKTNLSFAVSYQYGYNGNSVLDRYNAPDPRPDYYKNLPSYYESDAGMADTFTADIYRAKWRNDESIRQLDWNALYAANEINYDTVNGVTGKRSVYMLGADDTDIKRYSLTVHIQRKLQERVRVTAGLALTGEQSENYRKMLDLLGGDYYVNLNQFAERTYTGNYFFKQNDLNYPDRIVRAGDKYAYDYKAISRTASAWAQFIRTGRRTDLFIAARYSRDAFLREGLYRNGLFAEDSYGPSKRFTFFSYQLKGGARYKLNGRDFIYLHAAIRSAPQAFDHTFVSPRTGNTAITDPGLTAVKSMEAGYVLDTRRFKGRLTGFATSIRNNIEVLRFYHEGFNSFVNYVMEHTDVQHTGMEFALRVRLLHYLSATAAASWTQVFYTSDPAISIYRDNDTSRTIPQTVAYLKNMYVAAGPQSAYTCGLNYRSKKDWYASVYCNYVHRNYVDINPVRRTAEATGLLQPDSPQWRAIVGQEALKPAFTMDVAAGKSLLVKKALRGRPAGWRITIDAGARNLLNNRNIRAAGFEQLRFDLENNNPARFAPKYIYGAGLRYSIRTRFTL